MTGPRLRTVAAVVAFPVVFLASGGLVQLMDVDGLGLAAVIVLVPAAAYGAVVMRAWALAMPLLWGSAYLGVARLVDLVGGNDECSVCGSANDGWSIYSMMVLVVAVALVLAVAFGVYIAITISDRREAS